MGQDTPGHRGEVQKRAVFPRWAFQEDAAGTVYLPPSAIFGCQALRTWEPGEVRKKMIQSTSYVLQPFGGQFVEIGINK